MRKRLLFSVTVCLAMNVPSVMAQAIHAAPRPAAQTGAPAGESATPDGYAPIPAWLGQTRAPRPAKIAEYTVETVAQGLNGAFSFNFLPDGRMIVAERPGHLRLVGKDGKVTEIEGLPSNLWAKGQGLFEARPDRAFASNFSKHGRIVRLHRTGRCT
jgi:glucose/arabinose dehydrogenase